MSAHSSLTAAAMLLGTLFVAACSETTSPTAPTASFQQRGNSAAQQRGNSDAAHACQQGGYANLFRTDGTGFKNTGECVSYAAQGGVLARRLTATFTNVVFAACNNLTWGYALDDVQHDVESKSRGCFDQAGSDQTVSFLSTQILRVFLRDDLCDDTYFEDGNHGAVTGSNPYLIRIADSGGFCERGPGVGWTPVGDERGNLNVTKTIS